MAPQSWYVQVTGTAVTGRTSSADSAEADARACEMNMKNDRKQLLTKERASNKKNKVRKVEEEKEQ